VANTRGLRDRNGAAHGAAFVRQRRLAFDCTRPEFRRIFVHELFHFVWVRAGNSRRRGFEDVLRREWQARARGELGWSSELRKERLAEHDVARRSRRWREYCCESFCDTAAWLYSGRAHPEFTLARRWQEKRRRFFRQAIESRERLPI